MAIIQPFAALRPRPELANQICAPPYDVVSTAEARVLAAGNPLSFLHVSRPEIDLDPAVASTAPAVYAKGRRQFAALIDQGVLVPDLRPGFYLYRQTQAGQEQTGLVAGASCLEYTQNLVKKHELTRPDKELDRTRHLEAVDAQTGPAFLLFRTTSFLRNLWSEQTQRPPATDFIAPDGVRHTAWILAEPETVRALEDAFASVPALYIADGHHRTAAAVRVWQARQGRGNSPFFLSVIFPHDQVRILPYNRLVLDLNGQTPDGFLARLATVGAVSARAPARPARPHQVSFYLNRRWFGLDLEPAAAAGSDPVSRLDVSLLQDRVLGPWLAIADPRTSQRLQFVGGSRGTDDLEKAVDAGQAACGFSLYPTRVEDLLQVADHDGLMPPKSTWFDPKLRDGLFCRWL